MKHGNGVDWDNLYPHTLTGNVHNLEGKSVETSLVEHKAEIDVIKTKRVSVESFPLLGGETDDTLRIQRAYDTLVSGDTLIIPNEYTISNLVFGEDDIFIECTGLLIQKTASVGVAVTIGNSVLAFRADGIIKVKKETVDWTQDNTGVKFLNMNEVNINVDIDGFTNNMVLQGENQGCAYNSFHIKRLKNGKKNLSFIIVGTGWVNENKFFGGRFQWTSNMPIEERHHIHIPVNVMNNNVFFSPSLEGRDAGTFIYCNGQYNHFYSPRLEGDVNNVYVEFGTQSIYNQIIYPHASDNLNSSAKIVDLGSRNHIFSRDEMLLNNSRVRAVNFTAKGDSKQNGSWGTDASFEGQSTNSSGDKIFKGSNVTGGETFNVTGLGNMLINSLAFLNGKSISSATSMIGGWSLTNDASYNTNYVKVAAVITRVGTPFSVPVAGTLIYNKNDSKLYVSMDDGSFKSVLLT